MFMAMFRVEIVFDVIWSRLLMFASWAKTKSPPTCGHLNGSARATVAPRPDNASNPIGAARAVKNAGKEGKILIAGMDNLPETLEFVKQGVILVTKVQRQWDIGYWTLRYLVAMNKGLTIPRDHDTGASMITAESLK